MVVQVVLDKDLLHAATAAAKEVGVNRSALVREALREYLKRRRIREMEERDRRGYERHPQSRQEIEDMEAMAAWPEE